MAGKQLILNRYRPMLEAGSGGFATVQAAWDTQMQRTVAIKCIELSELDAARVERERRASLGADAADAADASAQDAAAQGALASRRAKDLSEADAPRAAAAVAPAKAQAASLDDIPPWEDLPEEVAGRNAALGGDDLPDAPDAICIPDALAPDGAAGASGAGEARADASSPDADDGPRSAADIPGLAEARAVAQFSDPNIVTVYNFEIEGSMAYLIMEYVDGVTLERFLREHDGDLTLDIIAHVFSSVAHALEVAHSHQVLHLDIKPANVLISRQGDVKVTDFGLATLADASGVGTAGGGTIGYMPLEQMRSEPLDARCDEWALASLAYEMLMGQNPFSARDLPHAEAAIEDAELVLPSLVWEDAEEGIDDVMFYALDPDPAERYDTVKEFEEELLPYLGNRKAGKKELALLVSGIDDEKPEDDGASEGDREPRAPFIERLSERGLAVMSRIAAVLGVAAVSFFALANVPGIGFAVSPIGFASPVPWALLVAFCVAAAIKPHVGALLAYASLGVSLAANGAWAPGILLVAASAAWWWFAGRDGAAPAIALLAGPVFGAVGFAPASAVLAGSLVKSAARAAGTTALAALAAFSLGSLSTLGLFDWNALANWDFAHVGGAVAAGGNAVADPDQVAGAYLSSTGIGAQTLSRLGGMALKPGNWIIAASWIAAAAVMSALSAWGTSRKVDVVAACAGAVLLVAGVLGAAWVASPGEWMPPAPFTLAGAIVPGVLGIVLAAIGLPDKVRQ